MTYQIQNTAHYDLEMTTLPEIYAEGTRWGTVNTNWGYDSFSSSNATANMTGINPDEALNAMTGTVQMGQFTASTGGARFAYGMLGALSNSQENAAWSNLFATHQTKLSDLLWENGFDSVNMQTWTEGGNGIWLGGHLFGADSDQLQNLTAQSWTFTVPSLLRNLWPSDSRDECPSTLTVPYALQSTFTAIRTLLKVVVVIIGILSGIRIVRGVAS